MYVDASLYFTDGITYSDGTAQKENGKLVELVIDELTVGDFTMQASVVYMNGRIHLSIDRVNDIQLSEMDVSMDASDISKAVDNILALLENPALMQIIEGGSARSGNGCRLYGYSVRRGERHPCRHPRNVALLRLQADSIGERFGYNPQHR